MKKLLLRSVTLLCACSIILFCGGFSFRIADYNGMVMSSLSCYDKDIESLSEIEEGAAYIIKAVILPDREVVEDYLKTKIKVIESYKGDFLPDDEIYIQERVHTESDPNGGTWLVLGDNYNASEEGKEYILFLYFDEYMKIYCPLRDTLGRYPVLDQDIISLSSVDRDSYIDALTNEDLNQGHAIKPKYKGFMKEVVIKYQ